ncbi:MAG: DNA adenine methylase, partial [Flammeovirgaceae bacterium]
MTLTVTRPIIRYYGAKFRLYDWISQHFPSHTTYCEPFLGSAAILLQKSPAAVEAG